jgi:Zn-dependent metalloprotease
LKKKDFAENLQNKIARLETSEATGVTSHITLKTPFSHTGDLESHFERFFTEFPIFSISDYHQQLKWIKKQRDPHFPDRFSTFFDQQHKGIKVFGARLHIHFNENREIIGADASIIPDLEKLPIHFVIDEEDAIAVALRSFYSKLNRKEGAIVEDVQKMIYRDGLFAGKKGENHLTWMVIVSDQMTHRDRIFIDAKSGEVLVTIPLVHSIHREVPFFLFQIY